MEARLKKCSEHVDVDSLYTILGEDPYFLERIDEIPFVDTPLHRAAAAGNTHVAMEIASLKPSLARKLNPLGLSPMHLALLNGHDQLVRAITTIDSELVRVKAKGNVTPLHYVAQIENIDLLAEFLYICPSSIEDLTVRCESAVHLAVKNNRLSAFKVLVGWLRRVNKEQILKWKDEDGNTALHIATATNQPEVVKLVIPNVNVNAKNICGLTAMDIFHLQSHSLDTKVGEILRRAGAKRASELHDSTLTLANYFSRDLSLIERRDKYLGIFGQSQNNQSPNDLRSVVLVVATLIATATYPAALSPPGGYWQEDNPRAPTNETGGNTTTVNIDQPRAGKMILGDFVLFYFFTVNSLAFYASVGTILIVISGLPYYRALFLSTICLLFAYYAALVGTFPSPTGWYALATLAFTVLIYIFAVAAMVIPWRAAARHAKLKRQVDNIERSLG